jgi:hypothetical protein
MGGRAILSFSIKSGVTPFGDELALFIPHKYPYMSSISISFHMFCPITVLGKFRVFLQTGFAVFGWIPAESQTKTSETPPPDVRTTSTSRLEGYLLYS